MSAQHNAGTVPRWNRRFIAPALAVVLTLTGWFVLATRDDSRITVAAVFADSSPLVPGNKVQLNGVEVGRISAIRLVDGQAYVEMSLERWALPLHTDATAKIQPVSLLGERFIALSQGSPKAPILPDQADIPRGQTGSSVDLDQLLNTLDDPTSTALAAMVSTLGEGIAGQGDTAAQALKALEPTLRQTDQLSTLLDQHNAVLDHLVVQAQKNLTASAQPLDPLVAAAHQTLGAVAANRQAMNDTLVELPETLTSARHTLAQLGDTSDSTADVLAGMRPLTDDLVGVSSELHDFADAAKPALASVPEVLDRLNAMLDEARPLVDDLGPAARDLSSVGESVHTLGAQLLTHQAGVPSQLEKLMTGAADWAMATSGYDGVAHYYRGVATVTPSSVGNTALGSLPPVGEQPPFNPVPPDPNGKTGYPGTSPLPFLPPGPNPDSPDNGSYTDPNRDPHSASGLTPKQEGDMFDQLLGGGK